jgi:two-component system, chemotaxis family, protein-glutamate methylesterase/glutaminase
MTGSGVWVMLNDVPPRCAIAIGASAGGVQAVRTMMAMLPADLPPAVLVVLHVAPHARSLLPSLSVSTMSLSVPDAHAAVASVAGQVA